MRKRKELGFFLLDKSGLLAEFEGLLQKEWKFFEAKSVGTFSANNQARTKNLLVLRRLLEHLRSGLNKGARPPLERHCKRDEQWRTPFPYGVNDLRAEGASKSDTRLMRAGQERVGVRGQY